MPHKWMARHGPPSNSLPRFNANALKRKTLLGIFQLSLCKCCAGRRGPVHRLPGHAGRHVQPCREQDLLLGLLDKIGALAMSNEKEIEKTKRSNSKAPSTVNVAATHHFLLCQVESSKAQDLRSQNLRQLCPRKCEALVLEWICTLNKLQSVVQVGTKIWIVDVRCKCDLFMRLQILISWGVCFQAKRSKGSGAKKHWNPRFWLCCFILWKQGQIWLIEITPNTIPLEGGPEVPRSNRV